eukprot:CAMPEP_0202967452 /NCGR_PEP_ID=MMETSP1396-20130829/12292_1 /ASSEMBLY_ACC=CAM_ASM_000872 /TAXON_ID= /ORGANISM="Pseudokeronopsis sp., Strain Brazil" /LENGTH=247 /DNA_ID=CAMNT_0049692473 /DNA_START=937 /DNA_END=1680 /DNA_ORIENTATION=-
MTTVGYGDVYAVSPFGRVISIMNALWGAFVISLLVGSISNIFELSDDQKHAIAEITNSKSAAASIRHSVQYFNAKTQHLKNLGVPVENQTDYVPTKEDLAKLKEGMQGQADKFRSERLQNEAILPEDDVVSSEVAEVKDYILEMNDKFDYLVSLFVQSNRLKKTNGNFSLSDQHLTLEEVQALKEQVKAFREKAAAFSVNESSKLKNPPPEMSLTQRVIKLKQMITESSRVETEEAVTGEPKAKETL